MRIDAHQHFWHYRPERDTWITEEMGVLKSDFLPDQLLPELQANNFQASIAVQANPWEEETRFLLELATQHPSIYGVVGWVDLCAEKVVERLEALSSERKLCGLRHLVQAEADDFMLRPDFRHGIVCLEKFGFVYDILIYARQLPAALDLVSRFPQQRFVIDHLAKPAIKSKEHQSWSRDLREIAANRNVFCKLSGLVTEAHWKSWSNADFKPYLDVAFEAFGVDRLMFGSDWPVCLLAATYRQVVECISDYMSGFSAIDRDKIFGLNAAHFYSQRTSRCATAT
jgi:L-fuconolactonase